MTTEIGADERLARAALTRVIEPGDENGGRWLRKYGARGLMDLLTSADRTDDEALGEIGPRRVSGLRTRAAAAAPSTTCRSSRGSAAGSSAPATRSGRPNSTTWVPHAPSGCGSAAGPI